VLVVVCGLVLHETPDSAPASMGLAVSIVAAAVLFVALLEGRARASTLVEARDAVVFMA
jgi:hypothetical protein